MLSILDRAAPLPQFRQRRGRKWGKTSISYVQTWRKIIAKLPSLSAALQELLCQGQCGGQRGLSLKRVIGGGSADPLENTNRDSPASRATRNRLGQALHIPIAAELSQPLLLPTQIPLQDKGLSGPSKDTSQQ